MSTRKLSTNLYSYLPILHCIIPEAARTQVVAAESHRVMTVNNVSGGLDLAKVYPSFLPRIGYRFLY